jgi:hypothetical protein
MTERPAAETWRRVEELFHAALEVPRERREAWLETRCAGDAALKQEVLSLLASDDGADATHAFGERIAGVAARIVDEPGWKLPRARVGPYRLLKVLGEGGMGTVFLAQRDDGQFERTVAVKLVRRGMDTDFILARFRRERQTLARLDHPNIGRMLDGGTTEDGSPFFVMEYIDGLPITAYCEDANLPVKERLRLFLEICSAVQHAHTNLVVHRDLKPGNILVDKSGRPKLLDFGICKLLYRESSGGLSFSGTFNVRMMTPEYASPEQVTGDPITVVSDVYGLGAVLYRLLSGAKPHRLSDRTPQALEDAICRQTLVPPSAAALTSDARGTAALSRALEGDLDAIVARAMAKDPAQRYPSVDQLAADLRRHLEGRPVSARTATLGYRARLFAARHKLPLLGAAVVLLALVAGVLWSGRRAEEARREAQEVRRSDAGLVERLGDVVASVSDARERAVVARRVSSDLDAIAGRSWSDPLLELALARAYLRIGELVEDPAGQAFARSSLERARELAERVLARLPKSDEARLVKEKASARLGAAGKEAR